MTPEELKRQQELYDAVTLASLKRKQEAETARQFFQQRDLVMPEQVVTAPPNDPASLEARRQGLIGFANEAAGVVPLLERATAGAQTMYQAVPEGLGRMGTGVEQLGTAALGAGNNIDLLEAMGVLPKDYAARARAQSENDKALVIRGLLNLAAGGLQTGVGTAMGLTPGGAAVGTGLRLAEDIATTDPASQLIQDIFGISGEKAVSAMAEPAGTFGLGQKLTSALGVDPSVAPEIGRNLELMTDYGLQGILTGMAGRGMRGERLIPKEPGLMGSVAKSIYSDTFGEGMQKRVRVASWKDQTADVRRGIREELRSGKISEPEAQAKWDAYREQNPSPMSENTWRSEQEGASGIGDRFEMSLGTDENTFRTAVNALTDYVLEHPAGFTLNPDTQQEYAAKSGEFSVALGKDLQAVIPVEGMSRETVVQSMADFLRKNRDFLEMFPDAKIGGWVSDGNLYVNLAVVAPKREAQKIGIGADQKTIWDFEGGKEFRIGGQDQATGLPADPTQRVAEAARRGEEELTRRREAGRLTDPDIAGKLGEQKPTGVTELYELVPRYRDEYLGQDVIPEIESASEGEGRRKTASPRYTDRLKEELGNAIRQEVEARKRGDQPTPDWYNKSMNELHGGLREEYGDRYTPEKAGVADVVMSILSSGLKPAEETLLGVDVLRNYMDTGILTEPTVGGTTRPGGMLSGFYRLQRMIDDLGERGAMEWLSRDYTGKEMQEAVRRWDRNPEKSLKLPWGTEGMHHGSMIFGPKVGAYIRSKWGSEGFTTMDAWHSRQRVAALGEVQRDAKGNLMDSWTSGGRRVFDAVVKEIAKETGMPIRQVQADLWTMERKWVEQNLDAFQGWLTHGDAMKAMVETGFLSDLAAGRPVDAPAMRSHLNRLDKELYPAQKRSEFLAKYDRRDPEASALLASTPFFTDVALKVGERIFRGRDYRKGTHYELGADVLIRHIKELGLEGDPKIARLIDKISDMDDGPARSYALDALAEELLTRGISEDGYIGADGKFYNRAQAAKKIKAERPALAESFAMRINGDLNEATNPYRMRDEEGGRVETKNLNAGAPRRAEEIKATAPAGMTARDKAALATWTRTGDDRLAVQVVPGAETASRWLRDRFSTENLKRIPREQHINVRPDGYRVSEPYRSYNEAAANTKGNVWIRQADDAGNAGRTLMIQISSKLLIGDAAKDISEQYYDKLYATRPGYKRGEDFWEIPFWMAQVGTVNRKSDVYVVRDMAEAKRFLAEAGYDNIAFSVLDVNLPYVKELLDANPKSKAFLGGYVENLKTEFAGRPNVKVVDTVAEYADAMGVPYTPDYDYRHFRGTEVIPRLQLSKGCRYKCAFCTTPKGVTEVPKVVIDRQVAALKDLNAKLGYLDDKTFGQAKNYEYLADIYRQVKEANPDFEGFIVQTAAPDLLKMDDAWLKRSGIKYVEIGVESFNDAILEATRKPSRENSIQAATDKLRNAGITLIPNIIVGMKGKDKSGKYWEETAETYAHTMDYLRRNSDVISHVNAYNLALYEGTELANQVDAKITDAMRNENILSADKYQNPQVHQQFHDELMRFGMEQLDRTPLSGEPRAPVSSGTLEAKAGPKTAKALLEEFQKRRREGRKSGLAADIPTSEEGKSVLKRVAADKEEVGGIRPDSILYLTKGGGKPVSFFRKARGKFKEGQVIVGGLGEAHPRVYDKTEPGEGVKITRGPDVIEGRITDDKKVVALWGRAADYNPQHLVDFLFDLVQKGELKPDAKIYFSESTAGPIRLTDIGEGSDKLNSFLLGPVDEGLQKSLESAVEKWSKAKYAGSLNQQTMGGPDEAKALREATYEHFAPVLQDLYGRKVTHEEVLEFADKLAQGTRDILPREMQVEAQARLTKLRQELEQLSRESAKSGRVTKEYLEAFEVYQGWATFAGRLLNTLKIQIAENESAAADPASAVDIFRRRVLKDVLKELEGDVAKIRLAKQQATTVDWNDAREVTDFYRTYVEPSAKQVLDEFRYINMLSSPRTHSVNFFSNLTQVAGLGPATRAVEAGVDFVRGLTGKEREVFLREVPATYGGMITAIPEATRRATDALLGKRLPTRPDVQLLPTGGKAKQAILKPIAKFNKAGRYVLNALEAGDQFFRTLAEGGELAALSARERASGKAIPNKPEMAMQHAAYLIYRGLREQNQGMILNGVNKLTAGVQSMRASSSIPAWFIPFVETPINILKQGIEYSPAGFFNMLGKNDARAQSFAKAFTGSMVMAATAQLLASHEFTFAPPKSAREREDWERLGIQPYSIKIGDTWYSYSKLGTLAYPIALVAAAKEAMMDVPGDDRDTEKRISDAITSYVQFFGDQSYMQGLSDFAKFFEGQASFVESGATGLARQTIPAGALVGWANDFVDRVKRRPTSFTERMMARLPGLSQSVPERVGSLGEVAEKEDLLANLMNLSPVYATKARVNPILQWTKSRGLKVGVPSRKIGDLEIPDHMYRDYAVQVGTQVADKLQVEIAKPSFTRLTREQQQARIDQIIGEAKDEVGERMFKLSDIERDARRKRLEEGN